VLVLAKDTVPTIVITNSGLMGVETDVVCVGMSGSFRGQFRFVQFRFEDKTLKHIPQIKAALVKWLCKFLFILKKPRINLGSNYHSIRLSANLQY
jgi:hypothetical protein